MAGASIGRFPLYTDADIHGPLISALRMRGWDVLRAVDALPEGTGDRPHFELAARAGRVLVSNDADQVEIALQYVVAGLPFTGLITWPKAHHATTSVSDFVAAFEALAAETAPFPEGYPIRHLSRSR